LSLIGLLKVNKYDMIVLFLVIFSLGLKFYRLDVPDNYMFDEVYFAFTAQEIAKGNSDSWEMGPKAPEGFAFEWSHPPVGKELSTLGILIFGDRTFGWRFFQALFGGLGTIVIYIVGKELFQNKRVGVFAAFLYTFDCFIFVLSRITMVDIFLMNFILLASLFVIKYARTRREMFIYLSGFFCGLSMSVKWSGVYATEFLAAVGFAVMYYTEIHSRREATDSYFETLFMVTRTIVLAFIITPLIVYILTYLPYFLYGHSLSDFIDLQKGMFWYHKSITQSHPYQSEWWKWPLLLKTVYMYLGEYGDKHRYIYAIGNPFIWWTGCLFLAIGVVQVIRRELPSLAFAVLSVFAYWLPWALSPRKVTFLYHFLPSLVFVMLIIAYFLDVIWDRFRHGKDFVLLYLFIAAVTFAYFFPIIAAVPIPDDSLGRYFWLSSWR
jgi:dolichyl-phosphate-mannose-protein mannosyltransferase